MVNIDKQIENLIAAWSLAREQLGIRVITPFPFKVGATTYDCVAYLPDFGGAKGMLIQATFPPIFSTDEALANDARKAGYYISFINPNSYSRFDMHQFQDALNDWGFYGSPLFFPFWMK